MSRKVRVRKRVVLKWHPIQAIRFKYWYLDPVDVGFGLWFSTMGMGMVGVIPSLMIGDTHNGSTIPWTTARIICFSISCIPAGAFVLFIGGLGLMASTRGLRDGFRWLRENPPIAIEEDPRSREKYEKAKELVRKYEAGEL